MRAAEFENLEPIVWMIGLTDIGIMPTIDAQEIGEAQRICKDHERYVINYLRCQQGGPKAGFDGYYVMNGVVYKVYYGNNDVKKITGDEARSVKRSIKQGIAIYKPEPMTLEKSEDVVA